MTPNRRRLALGLGLFMVPLWLAAQAVNLVELKKQEEERRKKLEKSKIVVTDTNIGRLQAVTPGTFGIIQVEAPGEPEPSAAGGSEAAPPPPGSEGMPPPPEQTREYWQSQKAALDQRIATLEKAVVDDEAELNSLQFQALQTGLVTEQLTLNQQIERLRKQLAADQAALAEARSQLEELFERARKARISNRWMD